MNNAARFLDAVKRAYGLTSDYQLTQFMGWKTASRVVNYRAGRSSFDDGTCIEIAEKLHLDPGHVLAVIAAERTTSKPAKAAWLAIAEATKNKVAKVAAVTTVAAFLAAAGLTGISGNSEAAPLSGDPAVIQQTVYYGKY